MTTEATATRQPADPAIGAAEADLMRPRAEMAAFLNVLPMVRWDRCVLDNAAGRTIVYGWIERADGRADFVVVEFDGDAVGFTTSSARWSQAISQAVFGQTDDHSPCRRVVDEFGALVTRTVSAYANPALAAS